MWGQTHFAHFHAIVLVVHRCGHKLWTKLSELPRNMRGSIQSANKEPKVHCTFPYQTLGCNVTVLFELIAHRMQLSNAQLHCEECN